MMNYQQERAESTDNFASKPSVILPFGKVYDKLVKRICVHSFQCAKNGYSANLRLPNGIVYTVRKNSILGTVS